MSSEPSLNGKVALITGASRGLGRDFARRLAAAGALVVVSARSMDAGVDMEGTLRETVDLIEGDGHRALALTADLDDAADLKSLIPRAVEAAGGVDILINNGGLSQFAPVADMPDEIFDATLQHYFRAPFLLSREAIAPMRAAGAGWIVNIGSVVAQRPLLPYDDYAKFGGGAVYSAMKAALARFTQSLAAELVGHNIAVNLAAPSTGIRTPGASRYIPEDYPTEPSDYLAETVLQLCHLPAAERSGLIAHSLHFPLRHGFVVRSLDGKRTLPPPTIPDYAHPDLADGE